jgi:hypothetical protein
VYDAVAGEVLAGVSGERAVAEGVAAAVDVEDDGELGARGRVGSPDV